MEEKKRYLLLELVFSFILLESMFFLFGDILSQYWLYFTFGISAGFCFSWFSRDKQNVLTTVSLNIAVLGASVWIIYSLLNSSMLYRDIIFIFVEGGFILEIIFSFYPPILTYSQALSIPLFMCFPVFVKDYSLLHVILVLIYIACVIIILRLKFYKFFKLIRERKTGWYFPAVISVVFFIIIIFVSWMSFNYLPLGNLTKGGLLLQESEEAETENEILEKEYFELQDKVQKDILEIIPKLNAQEERHDALMMLSTLIKESPSVMETKKAEMGLISLMKTPGPGLDKSNEQEASASLDNYLDKKIVFNLNNFKKNTENYLKENKTNIMDRFSIMNNFNKLQNSDTHQKIQRNERNLKRSIDNSSTAKSVKRELRRQTNKFSEWKTFEAYRNKVKSLTRKMEPLDPQSKKEFSDLLADIDAITKPSNLKKTEDKIKKLAETTSPENKNLVDELKKILQLKTDMLLAERANDLKEKAQNSKLTQADLQDLREEIDNVENAQDYKQFMESLKKFREKAEESRIDASEEARKLLDMKTQQLFNEKIEKVERLLKESNLPDKGGEILKNLEKLESERNADKLISDSKELKEKIEKLTAEGFISNESKEELIKEIEEITNLFLSMLKAAKEAPKEKTQADYQKEWEELIEKSSLKKESKEALKQLAQALFKAQEISQVEDVKKVIEEEINKLSKVGIKKEEIEKIKEALNTLAEIKRMFVIEAALAALRDKIEELQKINPQEAQKIQEFLEKIRKSNTNEQLKLQIEALRVYLESKIGGQKKKEQEGYNPMQGTKEIINLFLSGFKGAGASPKEKTQADYQKEWEELIEKSSLKKESKETLKQLAQALFKAREISQVENIGKAGNEQIENFPQEELEKEGKEKIKESFNTMAEAQRMFVVEAALAALKDKIEELRQVNPQEAQKIQEFLEKIKKSNTNEQLKLQIDSLRIYLESKIWEQKKKEQEEIKEASALSVFILPTHLVMPVNSRASFKALAIYNNVFIKEPESELEWFSSSPDVAWVDKKGIVHSLTSGDTQIYCNYKGIYSDKAQVTVVDKIDEQLSNTVESELTK